MFERVVHAVLDCARISQHSLSLEKDKNFWDGQDLEMSSVCKDPATPAWVWAICKPQDSRGLGFRLRAWDSDVL